MRKASYFLMILMTTSFSTVAQHTYSCSSDEVAFDGYDLVSYFSNKPLQGDFRYSAEFDGLKLQFATYQNLLEFNKNPERYMPEYGGWCATAVVVNKFVVPDYRMYQIQDGKLYFFEVKAFFNGKTQWNKNPEANQLVADKKFETKRKN